MARMNENQRPDGEGQGAITAADPSTQPEAQGTWSELLKPHFLAATVTLCLGVALFAFNEFFISTALPTAVSELGGAALLSWAFTLFLVFAILGGALAANLKRRFGARNTLIVAAIIFSAGTLLAGYATTMPQVLAGRIFQGLGEGIIAAICYALIPELFPSKLVPKIFGAEAIVWAMAAFCGPLVAGALTEYWSWRAAFFINIPAAVIFIALVLVIVPRIDKSPLERQPIPFLRLLALGGGILLISISGTAGSSLSMAALLMAAGGILWVTVVTDRKSAYPMLPVEAFAVGHTLGSGLWVILLMPLAQASGAVFLVYGLQHLWGLGPTAAGFSSAFMAMSWSAVAILVASIRSQDVRNRLIWIGPLLLTAGHGALILAVGTDMFWLIFPGQIAIGAGFGICWGTLSQLMMDVSSDAERDKTSALLPTLQSAGYAIGAAFFGLIANVRGFDEGASVAVIRDALFAVFVAGFAIATVSLVFGLLTLRLSSRQGRGQGEFASRLP